MNDTLVQQERPTIGRWVPGYQIPVINEREVRAAAGILLLIGGVLSALAWAQGSQQLLQPFGMIFMIDMLIRLIAGDRWSPSLALGRLIVRRQQPEWVGAKQKVYAWWLGFGLAFLSCMMMGFFGAPLAVVLSLCSVCLLFLWLEASFGICVGCQLQRLFDKEPPMYCPGGTCEVDAPGHPHQHDQQPAHELAGQQNHKESL